MFNKILDEKLLKLYIVFKFRPKRQSAGGQKPLPEEGHRLDQLEIGLALILDALHQTGILQQAQESGNLLVAEFAGVINQLQHLAGGVTLVGLHSQEDSGLQLVIGDLLGGGLLVAGILALEQFHLVVDEADHLIVVVGGGGIGVTQDLEVVTLSHLLVSHSINSFRF